jgi:hypothetical protein
MKLKSMPLLLLHVHPMREDIEACVADLELAVAIGENNKERGRSDPNLACARQNHSVRKLLGMEEETP